MSLDDTTDYFVKQISHMSKGVVKVASAYNVMSIAYYSFQAVVQQFNLVPQTTTVPPGGRRFILLGGLIDTIGELSVVL